jgi:hypothetical protein
VLVRHAAEVAADQHGSFMCQRRMDEIRALDVAAFTAAERSMAEFLIRTTPHPGRAGGSSPTN